MSFNRWHTCSICSHEFCATNWKNDIADEHFCPTCLGALKAQDPPRIESLNFWYSYRQWCRLQNPECAL